MAQIPYQPFPSVEPQGVPARSHDLFEIHTPPEAFGEATGRALERFGGQTEQAAGTIFEAQLRRAAMQNELIANDANTSAMQEVTDRFASFSKLQGPAAQAGLDQYRQDIQGIYKKYIASMPNLMAQRQLSTSLRYMGDYYMRVGTAHANEQWQQWNTKSQTDAADASLYMAGQSVMTPEVFWHYVNEGEQKFLKLRAQQGIEGDALAQEGRKYLGSRLPKIIDDVAKSGDIGRAEAIFAYAKDRMDPAGQYAVTQVLKPYLLHEKGSAAVDQAFGMSAAAPGAAASAAGSPVPQPAATPEETKKRLGDAIGGKESNNNPNAPPSVQGAIGQRQVMPATFARFKKPGEVITNSDDNVRVSDRYISHLYDNFGNDPARVAVGYFSGEGNIAPPGSQTPWRNGDLQDKNGTTVRDYTNEIMRRMGLAAISESGGPVQQFSGSHKADVLANLDQLTKDWPYDQRQAAYEAARQRFELQDAAYNDQERQHRLRDQRDKDTAEGRELQYRQAIFGPNPGTITAVQIANDPALQSAYGREVQDRLMELLNGKGNAAVALSRANTVEAFRRLSLPYGDPNKITSLTPINQLYGQNQITREDLDWLTKRFQDDRSASGQKLHDREEEFLKGVSEEIDHYVPMQGHIYPLGPQKMYLLRWELDQKIDAMRQKGEDPLQLFDPNNTKYFAGSRESLKPYLTTLPEAMRYIMQKYGAQAPAAQQVEQGMPQTGGGVEIRMPSARPPATPGETPDQYFKRTATP